MYQQRVGQPVCSGVLTLLVPQQTILGACNVAAPARPSSCLLIWCRRSLVTVILGALMMFLTSWKLALLTCATLPFMLLQFRTFAREFVLVWKPPTQPVHTDRPQAAQHLACTACSRQATSFP